jgi:hypothetical protein
VFGLRGGGVVVDSQGSELGFYCCDDSGVECLFFAWFFDAVAC